MKKSTKDAAEVVKNFAQVVALLAAAFWAVFVFVEKELPNLEAKLTATSDVHWEVTDTRCNAHVVLELSNVGGRPVDVKRIKIETWLFDEPGAFEPAEYVDIEKILTAANTESVPSPRCGRKHPCPLLGRIATRAASSHTFEWTFPLSDRRRRVLFDFDAKGTVPAHTWVSETICGDADNTPTPTATSGATHS